jgi:tetratricopeptide (TPR) repeat protein
MLTEEPETPFGESSPVVAPPPETSVALGDAPLPMVPALPEPSKPVAVPKPQPPAAEPRFPAESDEKPSVSLAVTPPGSAKPVPARQAPAKQAPPKAPPAKAPEQPSAVPDLPVQGRQAAIEAQIEFSRTARLMVGQLLEIPYRGAGWVFLGERSAKKGLPYDSRRLDPDGQSFMFRAEAPGLYALKFYRQDFVADYIVNDYVQVAVDPAPIDSSVGGFSVPLDRGRVIAGPRWPPAPEPADVAAPVRPVAATPESAAVSEQASLSQAPAGPVAAAGPPAAPAVPPRADSGIVREAAPSVPVATGSNTTAIPPNAPMEDYLAAARKAADDGRTASALEVLSRAIQFYPAGSDELWWLYGRLLEANGPTKDVKAALSCYKRLIDEYPQSPRYEEAVKRASYLERYYFEIR